MKYPQLALGSALIALLGSNLAVAQTPKAVLPLKRVRLYEAGVAYFERSGAFAGGATLPVPRSHLDDALKTLVVLDREGHATVSGVEMDQPLSEARSRALAGLPSDTNEQVSFETFLEGLRGTKVEITTKQRRVRGELVNVVPAAESGLWRCLPPAMVGESAKHAADEPCSVQPSSATLLMTEQGELVRLASLDLDSVRPLDPSVAGRLRSATVGRLGVASAKHPLTIKMNTGTSVTLGYVAEAPLWRASYRLVLAPDGTALQGWALIHNDTDENWRGVRVELVNGQPDSFLFPLAAPRYAERRLVTPDQHLPSVPQLLNQTADDDWDSGGGGLSLSGVGEGGGGYGYGSGQLSGSAAMSPESSLLNVGDLSAYDAARGEAVGALFRYALAQSIDLGAKRSLLVPFLREKVESERIAWFRSPDDAPRSSVLLTNTSSQTLPPGTIALFEGGGFAGESAIDRLQPKTRRLVHFGVDLDVSLSGVAKNKSEALRRLAFEDGTLTEHYLRRSQAHYEIVNRGATPRSVHLKLEIVNNAKVTGADELLVDQDAGLVDGVFKLAATQRKAYDLDIEEGLQRRTAFDKLDAARLQRLSQEASLPAAQRSIVERALAQFRRRDALVARGQTLRLAVTRLDERLRGMASTLELVRRADEDRGAQQAARLMAAEAERAAIRRELDGLAPQAALAAARRELEKLK